MDARSWREVDSPVYQAGDRLVLAVGGLFTTLGLVGVWAFREAVFPDLPAWLPRAGSAVLTLLGGVFLVDLLFRRIRPVLVRHAASDVFPDVSPEPLLVEDSVVHGRLTHELVEDDQGWTLRPRQALARNDLRFLLGFGIPFLTGFAALLAWLLHHDGRFHWPSSILLGMTATLLCGGSTFLLVGTLIFAGHRRLGVLRIPSDGGGLRWVAPAWLDDDVRPAATLPWDFLDTRKPQRLEIPRESVVAVQLCPWKFAIKHSTTWAVQGLLVQARSETGEHSRVPLLTTSDFHGAALLMQELADALNVPYLFHADAAGWKAEERRAKGRPPLKSGGMQS